MQTFSLSTPAEGFVPITQQVQQAVADSGTAEGICLVYCPHTTAGLTINENADPDVARDLLLALRLASPDRKEYRHFEGNSPAHYKALLTGNAVQVPVSGGRLALGRWQGIYFCEFDGPRNRQYTVQVVPCAAGC